MNELPELLEFTAHGVTAVLATWLGLLVVTRAGRARGAPIFAALCLLLVTWSVAIMVQRLTTAQEVVAPPLNALEDVSAFLLPPLTAHIAISIAFEGRRSAMATAVLLTGYVVGGLAIVQAITDPGHPIQFTPAYFEPLGIPGPAVAWTFAALRATVWLAGIGYLVIGLREAGDDHARRRQLQYAIATVVIGVFGGMLRILPEEVGGPRWIGVSFIAIATVLATYAVLAQHLFVAADVAARAVRWSLAAGLGVVVYVAALVGLERLTASMLSIEFPIVTALAIVVTLALFDPVAERMRPLLSRPGDGVEQARLLQAIGGDAMLAQSPDSAMQPALARLVRTFELTGAELVFAGERERVVAGSVDADDPLAVRLPLVEDGGRVGHAIFGGKRSALSFTPADLEALELATDYLGASMQLQRRQDVQASALAALRVEHEEVQSRGSALSDVLAEATAPEPGLHVFALGPLRAERDGEPIRRWGGAKAGSRQAEAVFAFLLDRGERGAAKDEILEIIWPDVDLDRADVAFHRTMLGLRSVLQPERRRRGDADAVSFHNDRYRLDRSVVAWSDVAEFERLLADAGNVETGRRTLEQARALYRGDYLDDCPFYGDSAEVEERRTALRSRYVDLLIELGERYADGGDRPGARACLREARALADEDLPRIIEALERLTSPRPSPDAPRPAEV